jgi:hypothetical protein
LLARRVWYHSAMTPTPGSDLHQRVQQANGQIKDAIVEFLELHSDSWFKRTEIEGPRCKGDSAGDRRSYIGD